MDLERTNVSAFSLRGLAALLLAMLLSLFVTACGPLGGFLSAPETPANQRYGHVPSAIAIIWDAAPRAEFYTIYSGGSGCRVDSGRPVDCEELATDIWDTYFVFPVSSDETSSFWVVACNRFGCSALDTANPAQPLPPAPTNVRVKREGMSLQVTWSPVPEATHYKVYHSQEFALCNTAELYPACDELAGNVVGTAYTHSLPAPLGPYSGRVVARTSNSLTITWLERDHGHYFWIAACANEVCSAISAEYTRKEDVASYQVPPEFYLIYRQAEGRTDQEMRHVPEDSSPNQFQYVDEGLEASTVYLYEVAACNEIGCSDGFGRAKGLTEAQGPVDPPATPSGFEAQKSEQGGPDDASLTWDAVEGATYYEVWQGKEPSRSFDLDTEISAPLRSTSDNEPPESCFYCKDSPANCCPYFDDSPNRIFMAFDTTSYKVRACNKAGCSPFTEVVTLR